MAILIRMKTYNVEMSFIFNLLSVHGDKYENRNINSGPGESYTKKWKIFDSIQSDSHTSTLLGTCHILLLFF